MTDERPSYFALMCEHMAATLSMLPPRAVPVFDGLVPLVEPLIHMLEEGNMLIINPEESDAPKPYDLDRGVRWGFLSNMHADDDPERVVGFRAAAIRVASKLDLRSVGRLPFLSPYPHLRLGLALLKPYERVTAYSVDFVSYHAARKQWLRWGQHISPHFDAKIHDEVGLMLSGQFSARYQWHVNIRIGDGPAVRLPTTAVEARRLFKARDLPPGRERRAALRHWVSEHYRRPQSDKPIGVSSHFRGAESFDWAGLKCDISPSEYDRDRVGDKP